jgi:hypothetical protein
VLWTASAPAGVVTNLLAGLMGSRWGIKWTLLSGLSLQLVGISVLYGWQDSWAQPGNKWKAIVFVTFAQVSGRGGCCAVRGEWCMPELALAGVGCGAGRAAHVVCGCVVCLQQQHSRRAAGPSEGLMP